MRWLSARTRGDLGAARTAVQRGGRSAAGALESCSAPPPTLTPSPPSARSLRTQDWLVPTNHRLCYVAAAGLPHIPDPASARASAARSSLRRCWREGGAGPRAGGRTEPLGQQSPRPTAGRFRGSGGSSEPCAPPRLLSCGSGAGPTSRIRGERASGQPAEHRAARP